MLKHAAALTFFLVVCVMNCGLADEPGTSADEAENASGFQAGLCVHLGVTDGKLMTKLSQNLRRSDLVP